jgi:hypothetical protein
MENQLKAQQIRIKQNDIILYPITTPESVIDVESGKNVKELIDAAITTTLNTEV